MSAREGFRADFGAAMAGAGGVSAADRLCVACVEFLDVDGAAISFFRDGATQGTFGSSGALGRRLDEFQFTYGEGPCVEAATQGRPVLVADLGHASEQRWPAFAGAVLDLGVNAVFALPTAIATSYVGVLDLFSKAPGPLSADRLIGGLLAAKLAALPILDLMHSTNNWDAAGEGGDGWEQVASLERIEVYQATGMLIAQLGVGLTEGVARLRAYAFASSQTASEVAWDIVERRLVLDDDSGGSPAAAGTLP